MVEAILVLTGIALAIAVIIYLAHVVIPNRVKGLEKAEEVDAILPGMNCGACGYPSCFAYSQALTEPKALTCCAKGTEDDVLTKAPCATLLNDAESVKKLEEALGVKLDLSELRKKAVIHCTGNSEIICDYSGIDTCKGASQLLSGYKRCPYACCGLGDCMRVCPQDAIYIDEEKNIAVIDPEKCNGCGLCVAECPHGLIELVPKDTKVTFLCNYQPLRDIPGREKCEYGCTHCRKCFKACEEEGISAISWDKEKAIPVIDQDKCTLCGRCIEVCESNTLTDSTKAAKPKVPVLSS
jgi:Na+-translocating ferredoxin:NAD+ oxidoreductase RNF subunit RnfB